MTCAEAQRWLLTRSVGAFGEIAPHLGSCDRCRRLSERIIEDEARIDAELEGFAQAGGFAVAWSAAEGEHAPTEPRRTSMYGWIAGMAAAATLAFAVSPGLRPDPGGLVPTDPLGACAELAPLEPLAVAGQLDEAQLECLSSRLDTLELPLSEQIEISRLQMVHLWSLGDRARWEQVVRHHLDQIDDSDPDLAYKLALYLSKGGPGATEEVLRYSQLALDHRAAWTGGRSVEGLDRLYRLRARASMSAWQAAADEVTRERWRARALACAREWSEHARTLGRERSEAQQMCEGLGAPCE